MIALCVALSAGFFLLGYGVACFLDGDARGELEHDLYVKEIECERLKRSGK